MSPFTRQQVIPTTAVEVPSFETEELLASLPKVSDERHSNTTTYRKRRYYSDVTPSMETGHDGDGDGINIPYSLITFLAVMQQFSVPMLDMTWHTDGDRLGGGRNNISLTRTSLETALVFKRISDGDKFHMPEEFIYEQLMSEISILYHPSNQLRPHVVDLLGVCWDIDNVEHRQGDGEAACYSVWPALVFERAEFGNLSEFLTSPAGNGKDLSLAQRLGICGKIGVAIAEMNNIRILHCDIKPENVLVFRDEDGFKPKVADFGFSVPQSHTSIRFKLPESVPWYAPETRIQPDFSLEEALRTEVFSFGLLCLWILFERQLSGILPLPKSVGSQADFPIQKNGSWRQSLTRLREENALDQFSALLVAGEADLGVEYKQKLCTFFQRCLNSNPQSRYSKLQYSLEDLVGVTMPERDPFENRVTPLNFNHLKLSHLMHILYRVDYRVREHIYTQLKKTYSSHPQSLVAIQLTLCRRLRFGYMRSKENDMAPIYDGQVAAEVEKELKYLADMDMNTWANDDHTASAYYQASRQGFIPSQGALAKYKKDGVLQMAEQVMRKEHAGLEEALGPGSFCSLLLKQKLASLLAYQERWEEAKEMWQQLVAAYTKKRGHTLDEKLELEILAEFQSKFGDEHADTLDSIFSLGGIYTEQSQWDKAERRLNVVVAISREKLGETHWATVSAIKSLIKAYGEQAKWGHAERLCKEFLGAMKGLAGPEHWATLIEITALAEIYRKQGRLKLADKVSTEALEAYSRVLGQDHLLTLKHMKGLASIKADLDDHEKAEELRVLIFEKTKRSLGPKHCVTLANMGHLVVARLRSGKADEAERGVLNMAQLSEDATGDRQILILWSKALRGSTYILQGRFADAEQIFIQVTEKSKEILGATQENTLTWVLELASLYNHRGKFLYSERLEEEVLEIRTAIRGQHHPDTLTCMQELATTYAYRGRLSDATELMFSCLKLRMKCLGSDHPQTRSTREWHKLFYDTEIEAAEIRAQHGFEITMDTLIAAANSPEIGVLGHYLLLRPKHLKLPSKVTRAVAENLKVGNNAMALLLWEYSDEVKITPDIVNAMVLNEECGTSLMKLLFDWGGYAVSISTKLLRLAAKSSSNGIMPLLLKQCGPSVRIDDGVIAAAVANRRCGAEAVSALLETCPEQFRTTTKVLEAAASNSRLGATILELLLDRSHYQPPINARVVEAAARNTISGEAVMKVLFEKRGSEVQITPEVVRIVAKNRFRGHPLMRLLLEERGSEVNITADVLTAVARNRECGEDIMAVIDEHRGNPSLVTYE